MNFSVKFSPFLLSVGTTGAYGLEGEFSNTEPTKKENGDPYQFSDIGINGEYYFIDVEGNIFLIVAKSSNGVNKFPYIELNNILTQTYVPQVADGIIAMINTETAQFYLTSTVSSSLKARVQRINVRDLIIGAGGSGDNIYNSNGTISTPRVLSLAGRSLTFKDGASELIVDNEKLDLIDLDLETNKKIIQHSLDGARWSYNTTNVGSTIKTKLT